MWPDRQLCTADSNGTCWVKYAVHYTQTQMTTRWLQFLAIFTAHLNFSPCMAVVRTVVSTR